MVRLVKVVNGVKAGGQEGRSAAQLAEDEQRLFNVRLFVGGEKNIIHPKKEPVDEHTDGPDDAEERKEDNAFSGEAGCSVF